MRFLICSVLSCLLILFGYDAILGAAYPRLTGRPENQWIANYVAAQKYLYERPDAQIVIVGSSLSDRLHNDLLPRDVFNLSFGGLSAFDGLNLILRAGTRPRIVLIESNVLKRDSSPYFDDAVMRPALFELRRHLVGLRDGARPASVGVNLLRESLRFLRHSGDSAPSSATPDVALPSNVPLQNASALFQQALLIQKHDYEKSLTPASRQRLANELGTDIAALKKRGVAVVFFELPINPQLCDLPLQASLRGLVRAQFPAAPYIRVADCESVRTSDGVHMTNEEAEKVTSRFARLLQTSALDIGRGGAGAL